MMKRYVQYGCGLTAPEEWVNYDVSPTLRFERIPLIGRLYTRNSKRFPSNVKYGNIVAGLDEKPESCDGVYCSHVLEHLALSDFLKAIQNTYSIMKTGAIFRCVVPDLKAYAVNYLDSYDMIPDPAHAFMKNLLLGKEYQEGGLKGFSKKLFGNSHHLWMWDEKTLRHELEKVGFKDVRNCRFGDCADPYFNYVEKEDRFIDAVAIECRK